MIQVDLLLSSCSIISNIPLSSCDMFRPLMNPAWSSLRILPISLPDSMASDFDIFESLFMNDRGRQFPKSSLGEIFPSFTTLFLWDGES